MLYSNMISLVSFQKITETFDISFLQGFLVICFVLFCLQTNLGVKSLKLPDLDFIIHKKVIRKSS